jgi:hypothetical protein
VFLFELLRPAAFLGFRSGVPLTPTHPATLFPRTCQSACSANSEMHPKSAKTPTVGLQPTTTRLRALRSAD